MENLHAQIIDYLLTQSWQIGVLAVAIAAVSLAVKNKSAHVRYLLWLIVLAKCLVPPLYTITLAVLPQQQTPEPVVSAAAEIPAVAVMVEAVPTEPVTLPSRTVLAPPVEPSIAERLGEVTFRQWLAVVWIVGAGVFVLAAVIKALRVNQWLRRERRALPAKLQSEIEKLFAELGVKTVPKVWLVKGIGQPFVWGLLRGGIYLPGNFVGVKGDESRRGVLGHELSHILRFDAAVNLLQIIAQAIFWFHPFVWWANKKIRAEREKCCDEMAIARLGAKAKDYSSAIVNTLIAEHEATLPIPSLAIAGPVKNIEDRIKTIMNPGKKFYKRPSLIAAITVLLLASLAVPTTLALTRRAEEKGGEQTDAEVEVKGDWGEAVEGLQCRLRPDGTKWQAGETPTLKADIRNLGTHQLYVVQHQGLCELWRDGRWYGWAGEIRAKSSPLGQGREYNDIPILLDEHWVSKSNGKPLRLRRRHIVRVAFITESEQGEVIRVHSNPVEIEILPKEVGSDSSIRGAEREAEARRVGVGSFRRRISFIGLDLTDAPRTTNQADLPDLFEERPVGSGSYALRDEVVAARHPEFWEEGVVYYVAQKKQFYIIKEPGHPGSGSKTFYGPFAGEPWKRFGMAEPRPVKKQYRFAIYLVVDPIDVGHPKDVTLEQLRLGSVPVLTEEDIVEYDWNEHFLKLTPEAWKRVPSPRSVWGLPFVVVADGQRCYLGAFWAHLSSYMPKVPFIGGFRPGWRENKIQISPAEPIAGTTDPRNDPRVRKILEELGIAKRAKVPKAGTNAPAWGEAVDGLRCRWFGAVKEVRAGAAALVGMEIENVSGEEIFWQCREGTWLIRHPQATPGTPAGTSPRFEVSLGEGVREATTEEAQRHHEGSGSAIGYYVLEPGAKMIITAAYPYPLVESGPVEVEGFLHRENPGGGGGYFVGQALRNVMTCPLLVLEIVGGVKKPVIEGLSVSVACAENRVETADELELVVSIENNSGGGLDLDHSDLEDDFPIVALDMASQESGPHFLCTKEGGWYGTGRVRKALKNNENKSRTIHVSDCWRLYGGRPILSPGRYRVIAKVGRITPEGALVEAESEPIWVTISEWPWGEALEGVRVRLRPDKAFFEVGEKPTLKADIHNGGKSEVFGQQTKYGISRLQFDNQWYEWGGGPVLGPPIKPGGQVEGIPIPLDNIWMGENKLNLSPGKHIIRAAFVGSHQGYQGRTISAVSNPVEITIIAGEAADETGTAAAMGVYKQLDEIVELSGWKPEMSFGDAIEELRSSVEPLLKIVVLWGDLAENADIEQSTQINLGPLPPVRLSFALELLLKSVSSGLAMAEVGYAVEDGVITIATVDSLPNKLETRVYDIALLVGPPLPGGYGATFYGKYRPGAEAIEKSNERAKEISKLIEELIEPDSWWGAGGEGVIKLYENRQLIVLQTREVHQKIEKLLRNMQRPGLGEARIPYPKEFPYPVPWRQGVRAGEPNSAVQIEGRFILVPTDANEIKGFLEELEDSEIAPLWAEPNVKHYLLEGEEGGQLLKKLTEGDPNCGRTLAAPKVTVLSGESAALSIQTQTVVALPPQVTGEMLPRMIGPGTAETIPTGTTLTVTPIISPDKKDILLNLNVRMNNFLGMKTYNFETPLPDGTVAKYEQELPQIETVSVQTRLSIPDGGTILLAGQKVKSKGEQDGQIVEKDLLILIKAEIVGVSWTDSNASPSGGGYLYPADANEVRNDVNIPNSMTGLGGGLFTYSESPYRSAEPNSPDVNSARRR